MRIGRKGVRMDDPNNNCPKTYQLKSLNISQASQFFGSGIWGKTLLGDPFPPWDIDWGHFGGIQLVAGLIGESGQIDHMLVHGWACLKGCAQWGPPFSLSLWSP